MFGASEEAPSDFDPRSWHTCEDYLFGIDLYNRRYYWEAHEAWEGLWKTTQRADLPGSFLQGLIQVAAAFLKDEMGVSGGAAKLSKKGLSKLRFVEKAHPVYCGVKLREWRPLVESYFASREAVTAPVVLELI